MKKLLSLLLSILLLNSCGIFYHYNYFGEVPRKPGRYPNFTANDYLKGELDEFRRCYDVTFYDINLNINPKKKFIRGNVVIQFTALEKRNNIRFDLYENLKIDSLYFVNQRIKYGRVNRAVIVSLPDTLIPNNEYTLKVFYEGKPQKAKKPPWKGGLVWKKDNQKNPWIGVTCESEGGSIWFPCKDHLSDEPDSVRISITAPKGLEVVSNGVLKDHISLDENEKYTWETHYPINIYNITFYAGNFQHFGDTMNTPEGILNLDYYVLPEHQDTAKQHFEQVKDVLKTYSKSFGPYPWIKEGFKLVESPFEGMEHQTAIAYGSGFWDDNLLGGDYIIVHEAAHEWWGNAVSVSDFSDIWLQEGFATYSEMVFAEKKLGYERSLVYANRRIAGSINNKLPIVGPSDVSYWDNNDADVYNKGAMILHTIRNVVNDSTLFFDILQTFYREHSAKSHVTSADFVEVVERKTGKNWSKFFEIYLDRREIPILEWYTGIYEEDQETPSNIINNVPFFIAKWAGVPEGFSMPVNLSCDDNIPPLLIEVTTAPTIFYLKDKLSCSEFYINKMHSYFDWIENIGLLYELKGQ